MDDELKKSIQILLKRTENLDSLNKTVKEVNGRLISLEGRIKNVEENQKKALDEMRGKISDIEKGQDFLSTSFDTLKLQTNTLMKRDTTIENENKILQAGIGTLRHELEQEKAARNEDSQNLWYSYGRR